MLPTVVATELREAVGRFLRSAFPMATPFFQNTAERVNDPHALIDSLLARPGALFKGPYLDIKLPFRLAEDDETAFRHLSLPFRPYRHQVNAFQRLCGEAPRSTIVATGTGSGKTECFMLPVLDDCLSRREQGIKTIVIYPMNALAADQARRFAREVAKLDVRLTVGLFVGGEQADPATTMGPDNVITCQRTLRKNPPDILLTNYKMLDFLLIRPKDRPLWRFNKPGTLRYLVVDELHTFDGAQGTDLACLIRRLRDRLEAGPELACVGTSATMGAESLEELLDYASQVFATEFEPGAIVGEDRLSPEGYLLGESDEERQARRESIRFFGWPEHHEARLDPYRFACAEDYLFHQVRLWFEGMAVDDIPQLNASDPRRRAEAAVRLGELLHEHLAFHELVRATADLTDLSLLARDWQQRLNLPSHTHAEGLLNSLVSLVAAARLWSEPESPDLQKWCQPFLHVRLQLWLRELRRMVCSVPLEGDEPTIRFADDLKSPLKPLHLPLVHCRECHTAAWGAVAKHGDSHLIGELQSFYQAWFQYSPQSRLLVPLGEGEDPGTPVQDFCPTCLRLQAAGSETCGECQDTSLVRVWVPDILRPGDHDHLQSHHNCPACGARESMAVLGYRAATLTSVMSGRLFATPYNDDFKLIAFSDSVQDAAHRAGFLGANTWRIVVRQALAGWLSEQRIPLSLKEMGELLPGFWQDRIGDAARFCGTFIAPSMLWLAAYEKLVETGKLPAGSDLPDLVSKRLAWECTAEFGRRSSIGRSLERTGMAAVGLNPDKFSKDVEGLAERLRAEVELLRPVDDGTFAQFAIGWIHHLRHIGAIYDPVLDSYLANKGKEFQLNRLPWMPGFGRSQRPPAAVTLQHMSPNFEALVQSNRDTWSVVWLKKTLGKEAVFAASEARQIFHMLLQMLTKAGWLIEREVGGVGVYLLDPERLLISAEADGAVCSHCRHTVRFAPEMRQFYEGLACLRPGCHGTIDAPAPRDDRREYGITAPHRLVPSEHTGLLPREVRERVERSFMQGSMPWDINLLSATPTLEMGIDIGELSSVFLCSVPPAQANYLQRIGRAGRRDGNALAVTIANGQNHDLFFYSEPMEMMAGSVHTPGVFLRAIAVLERQLIAYCFDRWVVTGIDDSAIPGQVRKVLDAVEHGHLEKFPYNLIEFVRANHAVLLSSFVELFEQLGAEAEKYLEEFIKDGGERSLSWRLLNRIQQIVEERKSLRQKIQKLKTERDRLKTLPQDEARSALIDEIERERSALQALLHSMNSQSVLNFFTDEGLLPNYAFPEEGVTLQSVILRRNSRQQREEGRSAFEKTSYSFQRSAQAALGELAPESRFYAISHQMQIEQIDLRLSEAEEWRFCDRCQHTERVDIADRHSACPRCGSPQWADEGQRHTVLKLRQVYSTVDDRADRIADDSEQREPHFFNRQMLVSIPSDGSQGGFRIDSQELPFGFEFLRKATFREVNFGVAGGDANTFAVAGRELPRRGFRICRHCGKVQKERPRRNEQQHAYTCKLRRSPEQETGEDYFDSLYLYRELNSEALRILLPLSEVAYSDEKLHSFIAALNLGLKAYFRGDVHHLEVTEMREPPGADSGERIYLVVYDRVPGGTGYLKDLMRAPENLMRVLEAAYARLTTCSCIDDEHLDGCYRCILAYRNSRNMPTISRKAAAELLGEILSLRDRIEPVASLSDINTNVLIESKLEQRFVDALAQLPGAKMTKATVNGKAGSLLTLPGADGRPMPWLVEHQVKVGPQDGVAVNTEIDVLLIPGRAEDASRYRPIAVYLDGLQYHHKITDDDVIKRSALLLSGRYWVYSLNWGDIPQPGHLAEAQVVDLMSAVGVQQDNLVAIYEQLRSRAGWPSAAEHAALHSLGSFELLARLLRNPAHAAGGFRQRAIFRAFTALVPRAANDAALRQKIGYEVSENAPAHVREALDLSAEEQLPGGFMDAFGNSLGGVEMTVSLPIAALQSGDGDSVAAGFQIHLCFDDRETESTDAFKANWRGFWHGVNQLQFSPRFSMATRQTVVSGSLEQLWSTAEALLGSEEFVEEVVPEQEWREVFELSSLDPEQVRAVMDLGLPEPVVGMDLTSRAGEVVISGEVVELSWARERVAVLTQEVQAPMAQDLPDWRLLLADPQLVAHLKTLKEQGVFQ